jgi:hypothetical protein
MKWFSLQKRVSKSTPKFTNTFGSRIKFNKTLTVLTFVSYMLLQVDTSRHNYSYRLLQMRQARMGDYYTQLSSVIVTL